MLSHSANYGRRFVTALKCPCQSPSRSASISFFRFSMLLAKIFQYLHNSEFSPAVLQKFTYSLYKGSTDSIHLMYFALEASASLSCRDSLVFPKVKAIVGNFHRHVSAETPATVHILSFPV